MLDAAGFLFHAAKSREDVRWRELEDRVGEQRSNRLSCKGRFRKLSVVFKTWIFTLHVGKGSFASVKQTLETTNLFGLKFLMFFLNYYYFYLECDFGDTSGDS